MNSLFSLISKAGSASLDELNARSSLAASALAVEIVKMVRNGAVTLSVDADLAGMGAAQQSSVLRDVIERLKTPINLVGAAETQDQYQLFIDGIQLALNDDIAARSINVNPTSRGFRFSA